MHPVQQHINSLSQRLATESHHSKRPEELVRIAKRLCGETLSWLVPRVTKAALEEGDEITPAPH